MTQGRRAAIPAPDGRSSSAPTAACLPPGAAGAAGARAGHAHAGRGGGWRRRTCAIGYLVVASWRGRCSSPSACSAPTLAAAGLVTWSTAPAPRPPGSARRPASPRRSLFAGSAVAALGLAVFAAVVAARRHGLVAKARCCCSPRASTAWRPCRRSSSCSAISLMLVVEAGTRRLGVVLGRRRRPSRRRAAPRAAVITLAIACACRRAGCNVGAGPLAVCRGDRGPTPRPARLHRRGARPGCPSRRPGTCGARCAREGLSP